MDENRPYRDTIAKAQSRAENKYTLLHWVPLI